MTPRSEGDVVASRTFERDDGSVELRLYRPLPSPSPLNADPENPPWVCHYAIAFPDGQTASHRATGIDSTQALLLAFASAKGDLTYAGNGTSERRPPVRWLGQDDLGLTINHFE